MPSRRILSVWFPRLGAERLLRRGAQAGPFAVVAEDGARQVLSALSAAAEAAGLVPGQPLREAQAMCPDLRTAAQEPAAEAAFLRALARWADRFSPLVACDTAAGLMLDITGCAHLFGGEAALGRAVVDEAAALGLSARCAIADTPGAAWALARFAGQGAAPGRSGDAIEQEARATRARAARRGAWQRRAVPSAASPVIVAPPGQLHAALAPLPAAALRLPDGLAGDLARLGLRRIGDLSGQPRAALGRRFGPALMRRLDQALGAVPEPLSAIAPPPPTAVRLSLPEPIGLLDDLREGAARLLARLCGRLADRGEGARALRLEARGTDGGMQAVDLRLARPMRDAEAMLALLVPRLERIDAGFGIDMLRLDALQAERIVPEQTRGTEAATRDGLADLLTRLGARVGLEAITRRHPAESRIPGKTALTLAAAWSDPAPAPWPRPDHPRPLMLWRPEPVTPQAGGRPCAAFRWRGRRHETAHAIGPERIAPEWWLDDPEWRTGLRDYWQVLTTRGERLWLFQAHGAALSGGGSVTGGLPEPARRVIALDSRPVWRNCGGMNMPGPGPLAGAKPTEPQVAFRRDELGVILSLYGRMVAAGEWRDYGISCLRDVAVFSVFRRTAEHPLYRIEKRPRLRDRQGQYSVIGMDGRILKRGHELRTVLRVLERKLIRAVE